MHRDQSGSERTAKLIDFLLATPNKLQVRNFASISSLLISIV